ncbi:hypothetical protein BHE74_00034879 [Ensete ventricosum]|nr:hypothetical protein BHE74_00034879 [Ensete ventricosum]
MVRCPNPLLVESQEVGPLQQCSRLHEGAEGFSMAGRGVTLILHTSWFNRSSWILAKEITAVRVYDCRVFTSP